MKRGDTVICRDSGGYDLTTGNAYVVIEYEPPYTDPTSRSGFTWPAYVVVLDDYGKMIHCHASRFTEE